MTTKEAIKTIEIAVAEVEWDYPMNYAVAFEMAIAALRAQQERENPKPLTLEELREMHGEPVWVQSPGLPEYGRWAIVEGVDIDAKILYLKADYNCHDYGKVWLAYRHKQEKD